MTSRFGGLQAVAVDATGNVATDAAQQKVYLDVGVPKAVTIVGAPSATTSDSIATFTVRLDDPHTLGN